MIRPSIEVAAVGDAHHHRAVIVEVHYANDRAEVLSDGRKSSRTYQSALHWPCGGR